MAKYNYVNKYQINGIFVEVHIKEYDTQRITMRDSIWESFSFKGRKFCLSNFTQINQKDCPWWQKGFDLFFQRGIDNGILLKYVNNREEVQIFTYHAR